MLRPSVKLGSIGKKGAASAIGVVVLAFLTAASQKSSDSTAKPTDSSKSSASSLEQELQSFEQQLGAPSAAESLFAAGRTPDLVVISSTDVHGEIEPCG